MHGLAIWFGLTNAGGKAYSFWSGIGSDLGEVVLIGGMIAIYRKHNCHVQGCWRLARHPVEGTPYIVCRKHNPEAPPTHAHILKLHREVKHGKANKQSTQEDAR